MRLAVAYIRCDLLLLFNFFNVIFVCKFKLDQNHKLGLKFCIFCFLWISHQRNLMGISKKKNKKTKRNQPWIHDTVACLKMSLVPGAPEAQPPLRGC